MSAPVVLVESLGDALAVVTLNRPDRRNALSIELLESLRETFESLAAEPGRRAVILRGAGPVFCAGLDLVEAADVSITEQSADLIARLLTTVMNSPLITIAAVQGGAYAGGGGLMSACDFAVMAEDAKIGFPEVRRGLIPALISVVLRGRLREGDLRDLFLLAEPVNARRAHEIGLVNRVVPPERLDEEARSIAETVMLGAPGAVRQTKELLRSSGEATVSRLMSEALAAHEAARTSDEAREGMAAFKERRPPAWQRGPAKE